MKNLVKLLGLVAAVWIGVVAFLSIINRVPENEQRPDTYYSSGMESFLFTFLITIPYILGAAVGSYLLYLLFRKIKLRKAVAGVLSPVLVVGALAGVSVWYDKTNVTNRLFLVPEGYTGHVYIVYNVKGAPELEKEDGYTVIPINDEGHYVTSTPDMNYGTVTDEYYYVDQDRNRTVIAENCVSLFGTGGYQRSRDEEIDLIYTGFELTDDQCSEEFRVRTTDWSTSRNQIVGEVLHEYYDIDFYQ